MSEIAITVSLLSLVSVIGLWIGHIKVKGVSLGIGGVLFGGIIVSHFMTQYGVTLDPHTLHFIQEFGLILFVYTIGIQVGPGFFASLRHSGLKLNGFALMIVGLSGVLVILLHKLFDIPLYFLWSGNQYTVSWCRSAGSSRIRRRSQYHRNGNGLCHCLPIRYCRYLACHVVDSDYLKNQCR